MKYCLLGGAGVFALHTAKFLLEKKETELVLSIGRNPQKKEAFTLGVGKNDKRYIYKSCHIVYEQDFLFEFFEKYQPDYIINFAALAYATSWEKSFRYYDTNVSAVTKIVEYLLNKKFLKKFLQVGTSELYGPVDRPANEDHPLNPTSPYAVSKLAADMHLESMFKVKQFPMNVIRPSNGYGSGQLLYRIIPKAAYLILKGKKFQLEGGGVVKKSFMHCRDIAEAIYLILVKGKLGEIYNAGPEQPSSMRNLIDITCKILKKNFDECIEITKGRVGEDKQYWLDSSKLFNDTGWEPKITLEEGIKETVDWVKNNMEHFKNEKLEFELRA
jgi:dTDP-glucose 4,6-dehydratase